jgi:hypothetical protein
MIITKRHLRRIIKEEKARILREYELYVDEKGNVYDDEGNVDPRGAAFGRRYGGETYPGTRPPWRGSGSRGGRSASHGGLDPNKIEAVEAALANKPNNFLKSILSQLLAGRSLSGKQKAIVKKIIGKNDPTAAKLFEANKNMRIAKKQLKRIVRKTLLEAVPDPKWKSSGPGDPGQWSEPPEEQGDYDYGYQDGGDGVPPMENATAAYSEGYKDGKYDAVKH